MIIFTSLPIINIYIFSITLIDSYSNMTINVCSAKVLTLMLLWTFPCFFVCQGLAQRTVSLNKTMKHFRFCSLSYDLHEQRSLTGKHVTNLQKIRELVVSRRIAATQPSGFLHGHVGLLHLFDGKYQIATKAHFVSIIKIINEHNIFARGQHKLIAQSNCDESQIFCSLTLTVFSAVLF